MLYIHRCEQYGGWEGVLSLDTTSYPPTRSETCKRQQKLNINLENCAFRWFALYNNNKVYRMSRPSSVVGIATCYGLDGPEIESRWRSRLFAPVQTGPGVRSASCTMGTGSFPGVKSGRGLTLTPHPLLMPWSRNGRAIPLLPLWAVQPVQSLSVL
jgi:hypothetical protein